MALTNFLITLSTTFSKCIRAVHVHYTLRKIWSNSSKPDGTRWWYEVAAVGMGSVVYLMKKDLRTGSSMLRQNLKTIRGWLEEQGAAASRSGSLFLAITLRIETEYLNLPSRGCNLIKYIITLLVIICTVAKQCESGARSRHYPLACHLFMITRSAHPCRPCLPKKATSLSITSIWRSCLRLCTQNQMERLHLSCAVLRRRKLSRLMASSKTIQIKSSLLTDFCNENIAWNL